MSIEVLEKSNS